MFETGESDEYPVWALPLVYRRMLWQQYGVRVPDFGYKELLLAIRLHGMETQRQKNEIEKMKKS